jgi:cytoskeleton protein RodZ
LHYIVISIIIVKISSKAWSVFRERGLSGELLKKRREELCVSIEDVSEALKIRSEYLSAIEHDNFDRLPVAVYTIGYIRCYAKYLDFDAEPVIAAFASHLASPAPSTIIPVSSSKRKIPGYFFALFILLAVFLSYAVYTYTGINLTEVRTAEKVSPFAEEGKTVSTAPIAANNASAEGRSDHGPEENKVGVSLPADSNSKEHRLDIAAHETTWIRISFDDGKSEEMILRPGTSKNLEFSGPIMMRIGNAGGVALKIDDKDLGVPGNSGQVVDLAFPKQ